MRAIGWCWSGTARVGIPVARWWSPTALIWFAYPPASPELQPAERLWPLINEAVANQTFPDLDSLEDVLVERCQTLRTDPATIRNLTCYHWWPSDAPLVIRQ